MIPLVYVLNWVSESFASVNNLDSFNKKNKSCFGVCRLYSSIFFQVYKKSTQFVIICIDVRGPIWKLINNFILFPNTIVEACKSYSKITSLMKKFINVCSPPFTAKPPPIYQSYLILKENPFWNWSISTTKKRCV